MRVAVFGMGHVGLVTAALLAEAGHSVTGVDVDRDRLAIIQLGRMPFYEEGLAAVAQAQMRDGRLVLRADGAAVAAESDVVLICVGTPEGVDGRADMHAVYAVLDEIAGTVGEHVVVVLRSTTPPDEFAALRAYLRERAGRAVDLAVNPEFLREGVAVADFRDPPWVVIGAETRQAGARVAALYQHLLRAPLFTEPQAALLLKYVSNAWHALKVSFANEIGAVARAVNVAPGEVMRLFCQDTRLNISPAYLQPGAPWGGSCLPKDLAGLLAMTGTYLPLLEAVERSNIEHLQHLYNLVVARPTPQRVGVIGLSFKAGTEDLRGSPWTLLVDWLVRVGVEVRVYDPDVSPSAAGMYRPYWRESIDDLEEWADVWLVGKPDAAPPDAQYPARVIYGDNR